jgi:predicted DNA-binding protein
MHREAKTERLRLRLTKERKERAEKWAERRGMTLSAYVRRSLEKQMDEDLLRDIRSKTDDTTDGD